MLFFSEKKHINNRAWKCKKIESIAKFFIYNIQYISFIVIYFPLFFSNLFSFNSS